MFFIRAINHIIKSRFMKDFQSFSRTAAIGSDGCAKKCQVTGRKYISVGENTWIGDGSEIIVMDSHFEQPLSPSLSFGSNVRVTSRLRVTCANHIEIGNYVLIAPDVFITDHSHGMDPENPGGYSPQPLEIGKVAIEDGVWIGQRVCVLKDVTIGAHSIIGANSVVTHDVPPYSIAVGSPARVVKQYNRERKQWEKV